MRTWSCLLALIAACGTELTDDTMMEPPDDMDPPIQVSALERCVLDGGALKELWSVGNQHGPVNSIVAGSLVVLGAQDGSVKQWTVDGDEPAYGRPFTMQGAPVADMAFTPDGHIVAATHQGQLPEWSLATAMQARMNAIADVQLSAVDVSEYATHVVTGTTTGELYRVERATGSTIALTSSLWGVWSIAYASADRLFTAGHHYGIPQVERRAADTPQTVVDIWTDHTISGHVRALAIDGDTTTLVAAGDGFVATFGVDALAAGPRKLAIVADHQAVGAVMLSTGALFATAGSEGTLKIWNTETAAQVASLTIAKPIGVAIDTAGTRLFTSGPDGRLHAFGCVK